MSEAIALSALNRKCGLIWARSAFSSDDWSAAEILRDVLLLLPLLLQARRFEHEAEHPGQRSQHLQIFAQQPTLRGHRRSPRTAPALRMGSPPPR